MSFSMSSTLNTIGRVVFIGLIFVDGPDFRPAMRLILLFSAASNASTMPQTLFESVMAMWDIPALAAASMRAVGVGMAPKKV